MKILCTRANKQTCDSCITALPFHSWYQKQMIRLSLHLYAVISPPSKYKRPPYSEVTSPTKYWKCHWRKPCHQKHCQKKAAI